MMMSFIFVLAETKISLTLYNPTIPHHHTDTHLPDRVKRAYVRKMMTLMLKGDRTTLEQNAA